MVIKMVSWSTILERRGGMLAISRNRQGAFRALFRTNTKPNELHIITIRVAGVEQNFIELIRRLAPLTHLAKTEISEMADDLQIPRPKPKTK